MITEKDIDKIIKNIELYINSKIDCRQTPDQVSLRHCREVKQELRDAFMKFVEDGDHG